MAMTFRTNVMGYQILLHSEVLFSKSPFNIIKFSIFKSLLNPTNELTFNK
jgi:hypothetical protein